MVLSFPNGKLEYVNPALKEMLGYEGEHIYADDVVITHFDDIEINEDIRERLTLDPFTSIQIEKRYQHRLGHAIYAQLNIVAQADDKDDSVVKRYISHIIDLTEIKKADAAEILLNHLVNQSNDAIYVVDPKFCQLLNCNHLAYRRLGYSKDELLKLTVPQIMPNLRINDSWQEHVQSIQTDGNLLFESIHKRKDGTEFPVESNISFIEYHESEYLLAIVRDISRRKQKEREAIELSNLDPLTKLPNRRLLEKRLDELIDKAIHKHTLIAFLYIDIDNFKPINDNYGHTIGDGVLVGTASRLKHCVRSSDIVTRLGGDEFLIVMAGFESKHQIKLMADKVLKEFSSPFKIQNVLLNVDASIGVSVYSDNVKDLHTLIQLADEAMYEAKKEQGSSIYFI